MPVSLAPWLTPEERSNIVERLICYQLIKWDNGRSLKLKSGGFTDIYINLRNARGIPGSSVYVARVFANAIFRLGPDRFAEVPDSVTPFTSTISELVDIPYVTIRDEEKAGRVSDAKVIGDTKPDETICIYDDVITDGQSKLGPYRACLARDLKILPLVVLVDRQQGWKKKFAELGINMDVWSGMTLHDVRRHLIERGYMKRCDPVIEENNPIIVALDGKSWEEILPLIDVLRTSGCILKVNDLLFNKGIENLIPDLQVYGRVMADLKGHDIPNTVKNITKHLLLNPPWAVTVHASGSKEMVEAAVNTLKDTPTKVLAVTVLTSIDLQTCDQIYSHLPIEQVKNLARIANRAGAHGLVCSPEEVKELRQLYPKMILVTPGVRSPGVDAGDQKRISTPSAAIDNGANYLVMGRQILEAIDPAAEIHRVQTEEIGL